MQDRRTGSRPGRAASVARPTPLNQHCESRRCATLARCARGARPRKGPVGADRGHQSGRTRAPPHLGEDGPARRLVRRVPRVPRRDHRQRRVPQHPRVVPGRRDRRAVVDPQRLQHRLRRVPRRVRPPRRPARPPARVHRRRGPVFTARLGALRDRARRRDAHRLPRRPGARRRDPRPGLARAGGRGVPARPPLARHRAVGRVGRARLRPRPAHRRRARRAGRLALGLPRQPAVRPRRALGRTPPARREPRPGTPADAGPRRRDALRARCSPSSPSASSRARTGAGRARRSSPASSARRRCSRAFVVSSRAAPLAAARPRAAAHPAVRRRQHSRRSSRASGFYAYLLTQHPVAAVRLGLLGARLGSRRRAGRARRGGPRGASSARSRRSAATAWSSSRARSSGRWPTSGTLTRVEVTPDFLGAWLPGQIISGIGVGATLPVLGSAALAAVPGGRFATASAVNSSARQIGAVLGIAILVAIVGTPDSAHASVDSLRARLGLLRLLLRGHRGDRAVPRPGVGDRRRTCRRRLGAARRRCRCPSRPGPWQSASSRARRRAAAVPAAAGRRATGSRPVPSRSTSPRASCSSPPATRPTTCTS